MSLDFGNLILKTFLKGNYQKFQKNVIVFYKYNKRLINLIKIVITQYLRDCISPRLAIIQRCTLIKTKTIIMKFLLRKFQVARNI